MTTAEIQVKYVNPPKEAGWKNGMVKTNTGEVYLVPLDKLSSFEPGKSYAIEYEQGTKYRTFKAFASMDKPGGMIRSSDSIPILPPTNGHDKNALNIFVTGIVGRAMGSGKFEAKDIPFLTANAIQAYKDHLA